VPGSHSPPEQDPLTSDDIFGEILDEVGGHRLGSAATPPGAEPRRAPIRVQVSEPGEPAPARPARGASRSGPGRPAVKELLPEDVAALLDAFEQPEVDAAQALGIEPGVAPSDPEPALPQDPLLELETDEEEGLAASEFDDVPLEPADAPEVFALDEPAAEDAPPAAEAAAPEPEPPAHEEPELRLDVEDEPPPYAAAMDEEPLPPPPPPAHSGESGTDEGLRDLMNLMRLNKSRTHKMGSGPNKFTVASPSASAEAAPLDLLAVAERAFAQASAAVATPTPAPPAAPPAAPTSEIRYGPYRLLQRVAVGGMAEVFRAKRTGVEGFEKVVAVKRILPHLSDNKEFVDMFINEAKMVAGLTHPSIVQIFDLGKIDKTYFIAMDYVHGRDLRSIMRRAREKGLRIPLDLSVLIASRVCSALEFAHRKKDERGRPMLIVHRDVSPQNILISFEGEVKLTDFGIAKAATKASVTDAGALRGKLLYMSPEQAWGKPMDRRSDLFSLGIVFYEMTTEQKPFVGSSEMSVLEMVRECRVAPPSEINPRIPERLERVLLQALARDPEDRYQDAAEMYRDLERVLHERQPPTAADLARFMEVLFDEAERSEAPPEAAGSLHAPDESGEVHLEFEEGPAGEPDPAPPPPPPATRDPMSIQKLLKRFGIK
jgi:serine/threonine protein kinase